MGDLLAELRSILGSERAALKLLINHQGLAIDGDALSRAIPGYPEAYRTKRSTKRPRVVDGRFIDTDTSDRPCIPTELGLEIEGMSTVVKVNYRPDSPFCLQLREGELVVRKTGTELALPASLLPRTAASTQHISGRPGDEYVQVIGRDRIGVLVFTGCQNWFKRNQCRFCDSCASRPGEVDAKPSLNDLETTFARDVDRWWGAVGPGFVDGVRQAYALTLGDPDVGPHRHVEVMAGNLFRVNDEWRLALDVGAALACVRSLDKVDSYVNLLPPPDPEWMRRAHAAGFRKLIANLEVFGAKAFRAVCPGKNQLLPYDTCLERMDQAVGVFGAGNVYCGFVFGAQPRAEAEEGARYLAARGIVPDYTSFTPKAGTPWAGRPRPDVVETARFVATLADIHRRHGYRPSCCALSLRSSVLHEALGA